MSYSYQRSHSAPDWPFWGAGAPDGLIVSSKAGKHAKHMEEMTNESKTSQTNKNPPGQLSIWLHCFSLKLTGRRFGTSLDPILLMPCVEYLGPQGSTVKCSSSSAPQLCASEIERGVDLLVREIGLYSSARNWEEHKCLPLPCREDFGAPEPHDTGDLGSSPSCWPHLVWP